MSIDGRLRICQEDSVFRGAFRQPGLRGFVREDHDWLCSLSISALRDFHFERPSDGWLGDEVWKHEGFEQRARQPVTRVQEYAEPDVLADLGARMEAHKTGTGSVFAGKYGCNRLVWFERFDEMAPAIAMEKRLKRWPRKWKIDLIEEANPNWDDLPLF